MHILIIYAHPEPASFNGTLKDDAIRFLRSQGHTVEVSDLYAEHFDPVEGPGQYSQHVDMEQFLPLVEQRHAGEKGCLSADIRREIGRLERANLVIFQFPIWWHAQPAILKGWFDRVFVNGLLYNSTRRYDRGHFVGKKAIVSTTTGAPESSFEPAGRGGDIELLLWPIHYSLYYMGFSVLCPFLTFGVSGQGYKYESDTEKTTKLQAARLAWINRLKHLRNEPPLEFYGWESWDTNGRHLNAEFTENAGLRFRTARSSGWRERCAL